MRLPWGNSILLMLERSVRATSTTVKSAGVGHNSALRIAARGERGAGYAGSAGPVAAWRASSQRRAAMISSVRSGDAQTRTTIWRWC